MGTIRSARGRDMVNVVTLNNMDISLFHPISSRYLRSWIC